MQSCRKRISNVALQLEERVSWPQSSLPMVLPSSERSRLESRIVGPWRPLRGLEKLAYTEEQQQLWVEIMRYFRKHWSGPIPKARTKDIRSLQVSMVRRRDECRSLLRLLLSVFMLCLLREVNDLATMWRLIFNGMQTRQATRPRRMSCSSYVVGTRLGTVRILQEHGGDLDSLTRLLQKWSTRQTWTR